MTTAVLYPKPLVHIGDQIFSHSNCPDSHKCFTFLSVCQSSPSLKPARGKKRERRRRSPSTNPICTAVYLGQSEKNKSYSQLSASRKYFHVCATPTYLPVSFFRARGHRDPGLTRQTVSERQRRDGSVYKTQCQKIWTGGVSAVIP